MAEKNDNGRITIAIAVITVVGSICTALIANWDKVFPKTSETQTTQTSASLPQLPENNSPQTATPVRRVIPAFPKSYSGFVGRLKTLYSISWNTDGTITGTYYYPDRNAVKYILKGKKMTNGSIELTEFTNNIPSATCTLFPRDKCYMGTMINTDGRQLKMSMCEID